MLRCQVWCRVPEEEDDSQKPRKRKNQSKQSAEAMWERKAKRRKRSRSLEGEDRRVHFSLRPRPVFCKPCVQLQACCRCHFSLC